MKVLFDSNIVIDALNGVVGAREAFEAADDHFVSVITRIEVLAGCQSRESEAQATSILAGLSMLELSEAVADEAIRIRRTGRLRLPDAIILATARVHGLTLCTRNTKDFRRDFPEVQVPYEL
ncbi:MAG: PIN domain-containing protein [bacterium]